MINECGSDNREDPEWGWGMGKETSMGKLVGGRRRLRSLEQRDRPDQLPCLLGFLWITAKAGSLAEWLLTVAS